MPKLNGQSYKYDEKGKAAYARALMKKLKKKHISTYGDQSRGQ